MDIKEFKKLKVGNKVKIIDEPAGLYWNLAGGMGKWLGKTMTIRLVSSDAYVKMKEDSDDREDATGWCWHPHMIAAKIDEPATIETHIIRGNKTIVRLSNGKVGIARCNPQDSFDVYEGLRIATARAYGKEPFADREDATESVQVRRVRRFAGAGEYVEIVNPDKFSIQAGLKRGQIRRVSVIGGSRYVGLLPCNDDTLVRIGADEYAVLENYPGGEV